MVIGKKIIIKHIRRLSSVSEIISQVKVNIPETKLTKANTISTIKSLKTKKNRKRDISRAVRNSLHGRQITYLQKIYSSPIPY